MKIFFLSQTKVSSKKVVHSKGELLNFFLLFGEKFNETAVRDLDNAREYWMPNSELLAQVERRKMRIHILSLVIITVLIWTKERKKICQLKLKRQLSIGY